LAPQLVLEAERLALERVRPQQPVVRVLEVVQSAPVEPQLLLAQVLVVALASVRELVQPLFAAGLARRPWIASFS
jgi:hypothetical protein